MAIGFWDIKTAVGENGRKWCITSISIPDMKVHEGFMPLHPRRGRTDIMQSSRVRLYTHIHVHVPLLNTNMVMVVSGLFQLCIL